jgi:hypothetical protein
MDFVAGTVSLGGNMAAGAAKARSNYTVVIRGLANSTPTNQPPSNDAGGDQSVTMSSPATATLNGAASDDGLPSPPAALTHSWTRVSGPAAVSFSNANTLNTSATFTQAGTYVLRLTTSDGKLTTTDDVTITVNPPLVVSNLSVASGKSYMVDTSGLTSGDLVHTDRNYTYTSVPGLVQGSTFIRTANDDKNASNASFLSFSVNRDVQVYVAYDVRGTPAGGGALPNWLKGWSDTGLTLGTTDVAHRLYSMDFVAGTVSLGGNMAAGAAGAQSNYTVMIVP